MRKLKVTEMHRITVEEFKHSDKLPLIVVVDNVRSLYNIGSIFRTADAFRVESIYLCGITATPPHAEIHKTALGAEESVNWKYYKETEEAIQELKENAYKILAVEQCENSTKLPTFMPDNDIKYAIVLGNEVKGVQQQVVDQCDGCLEIPQFGTKHSMNVSVVAGILMWHFAQSILMK